MELEMDARPIVVRADIDKVNEEEMARLIGTTPVALKRKRQRGVIPYGVYATVDGRITYSIRRYDEWVESQWPQVPYLEASNLSAAAFASASPGTRGATAKRSGSPQRHKASKQPQVFVLQ